MRELDFQIELFFSSHYFFVVASRFFLGNDSYGPLFASRYDSFAVGTCFLPWCIWHSKWMKNCYLIYLSTFNNKKWLAIMAVFFIKLQLLKTWEKLIFFCFLFFVFFCFFCLFKGRIAPLPHEFRIHIWRAPQVTNETLGHWNGLCLLWSKSRTPSTP